ncbi:MAG TPA: methyltransferase domain-containing protein [Vicinamibacteria bacterium]|nr:methyltransferase domain-containing protein [Vicinamibacteria bacterium]
MDTAARGIAAYDLPGRVAAYDADMDLMHPNRARMVEVALEVLPFQRDAELRAIDLGTGTGFLARRFLERFPAATLSAVDGAAAMLDLARGRLGPLASRVELVVGDFRRLDELGLPPEADVVLSSFALHHLTADEKRRLLREVASRLTAGGWFVNADLVVSESAELESRIQALRVEGILLRAAGRDPRFVDVSATRAWLEQMEAAEGDQPLTLASDLGLAREAGLHAEVLWKEHREVVWGGPGARLSPLRLPEVPCEDDI